MEKSIEVFSYEPEFVNEESSEKELINSQLMAHETSVQGWVLGDIVKPLYHFYGLFNRYFFEGLLPVAVIKVESLRHDRPGSYRSQRNGFGLMHEICLNLSYRISHLVFQLAVLMHETLHIRQNAVECKGYHGKDFQIASEAVGVPVNGKGEIIDISEPFLSFVKQNLPKHLRDFDIEEIRRSLHFKTKTRGRSTLKKYSCGCGPIRVGRSRFRALCLDCRREFVEL